MTPGIRITINSQEVPAVIVPGLMLLLCALAWYGGRLEFWIRGLRAEAKRDFDRFKGFDRVTKSTKE